MSGGVGAWINHRRKEVGRERRKKGRGNEWAPEGSKAELDPGWRRVEEARKPGPVQRGRAGRRRRPAGRWAGPLRCVAEKDSRACSVCTARSPLWTAAGPGVGIPGSGVPSSRRFPGPGTSAKPCQIRAWPPSGSGCLGNSSASQDQSLSRGECLGWATWGGVRLGSDREIPVVFPR